ncbi:MAG: PQQ-binding-like beta-propeller repeat protein [Planctomycetota bacterium]
MGKMTLPRYAVCISLALLILLLEHVQAQPQPEPLTRAILDSTGVRGGLIVHLGCGDGKLTAALRLSESYIVHGLERDAARVAEAREHIRSLGLYGKVSVALWHGDRLPYADNLVNLIVASGEWKVASEEILRVLAPNGVALFTNRQSKIENRKLLKPWTTDIDEWTHFLHGPDNNAVARDSVVGPPGRIQWTAGPMWSKEHDVTPSIFGPVSAKGRLFYIQEEGPVCVIEKDLPEKHSLVARDAFNGVLLWKRPMSNWYSSRLIWGHIPVHTQRRLVAVGDRVYVTLGLGSPVTAIDAATGKTIREYQATEDASEIVHDQGLLALAIRKTHPLDATLSGRDGERFRPGYPGPEEGGQAVMVVNAETGETLWRSDRGCLPLTLAVNDGRLFFAEAENVACLDLRTGKEIWCSPCIAKALVAHDGIVLAASHHERKSRTIDLAAFSVEDGRCLWTRKGDCLPNFSTFFAPVDLFVAQGLVWGLAEDLEWDALPGSGHLLGLDPTTGEVKRKIPLEGAFTAGHHVRCYKGKATERFLLFNKRGIEFVGLDPEQKPIQTQWVRGACRYGILPCNGLIYAPSHACACYPAAMLRGFYALAPEDQRAEPRDQKSERLERGTAYSESIQNPKSKIQNEKDWPTYRRDAARSGATSSTVPDILTPLWSVPIGQRLSAPTVAEGKVFVADIDAHTVHAVDAQTGKEVWQYTAGARVDSPPTIHKGMAIFGCRDGWVYCLRASDGALAWRFRGAPEERWVGAYDQVESAWPVHGSVLVKDDVAYFAAGRSSFLDGGIIVRAVDAATGKLLHEMRLSGPDPQQHKDIITAGAMPGAVPDILTSDGANLYLRHVQLDPQLSVQPDAKALSWGVKGESHILVGSGFLDDTFFNRTVWQYGIRIDRSQMLVVDGTDVYGLRVYWGISWNCPVFHPGDGYLLFRQDVSKPVPKPPPKEAKQLGRIPYERYAWHTRVPVRAWAMVLTGASDGEASAGEGKPARSEKRLFIAGPPDVLDPADPLAAFEGRKGGLLWTVSATDGKKLAETKLDSPSVFDGMAAAEGRLYIATKDGRLTCMGEK